MRTVMKLAAAGSTLLAFAVQAHPGHGLGEGSHWHASDAWGWGLGLAAAAAALWFMRRK